MNRHVLAALCALSLAVFAAAPAAAQSYTVNDALCVNATSPSVSAKDCGLAPGSAAAKNTGTSVNDPGTGKLEALLPVQAIAGTSHSFVAADLQMKTRRSNSGTAMTDTLPPSTTTGLINGARVNIANADATAADTVSAGAGTSISSSCATLAAGRDELFVYDLPTTTWRGDANSCSAVLGPATSTANDIATYADTSGKSLADTGLSALLDLVFGTTQGGVLYRGASSWSALAPGTSGQVLETQGTSANPQWAGAPQQFMSNCSTLSTSATVKYCPLNFGAAASSAGSTNGVYTIEAGTIRAILVTLSAAPANSDTVTFTVYINGAASAATCTVATGSTFCTASGLSVAVTAGEVLYIVDAPSGTVAAATGYISTYETVP